MLRQAQRGKRASKATPAPAAASGTAPAVQRENRWAWLRYWEFWLAVALAAFLRLWHVDVTQFLDDQVGLLNLARGGILRGAWPVTGIPSSIGTLNPPLSVYLIMPFAVFGKSPLPAVVSIALWNVLGVAFCYLFSLRYFGRRVAATAALLFATCGAAVNYSRFLWQQNYLPPLLVLWAATLFAACAGGRRRWFIANIVLLVVAVLLHPTAVFLVPVTLIAILLAPRAPTRRDYAVAAAVIVLLAVPSLIWEAVSRASDLRILYHYLAHRGSFSTTVFHMLYLALGAPDSQGLGSQSLYAAYGAWYPVLNVAAATCVGAGFIVLTVLVLAPARAVWLAHPRTGGPVHQRVTSWLVSCWRGLRADAGWRRDLLLWLWFATPIILMIHHSGALYVHYLMVLYPVAFIVAGFAVRWLLDLPAHLPRLRISFVRPMTAAIVFTLLGLLVAGQTLQSALYPAALASGHFDAYTFYGYPLGDLTPLEDSLGALQRQRGATAMFVATPVQARYRAPLDYLLVGEHPDRISFPANCLVLPAPGSGPTLVVSTQSGTPAAALLPRLPTAAHVTDLPVPGGPPFSAYQVSGALAPLPDETPVTPAVFSTASGPDLRLDAASVVAPTTLRLRWTVLASTPTGQLPESFRVLARPAGMPGAAASAYVPTECQPERWQAGETLFTWISLAPASTNGQPAASVPSPAGGSVVVSITAAPSGQSAIALGPLRLLSAQSSGTVPASLTASLASAPSSALAPGGLDSTGAYTLPLAPLAVASGG